jgi:arginyl-tRNA synthetase
MSRSKIESLLNSVLADLGIARVADFKIDIPPRQELGDYASNIAILYAKKLSQKPLELADKIACKARELDKKKILEKVEVALPGFVNFTLTLNYLQRSVAGMVDLDHAWGKSGAGQGEKILLEFVSANPTGPLHVGHGR